MSDGNLPSVLRCQLCSKPFDKQSTLKRHGYYCRSRTTGIAARARSCTCCAKAKARCDNKRPECSRCTIRGIECHYPAKIFNDSHPLSPLAVKSHSLDVHNDEEPSNGGSMTLDSTLYVLDPDFANLGSELFDWHDTDNDFVNLLDLQTSDQIPYPSLRQNSSSLIRNSTSSAEPTIHVEQPIFSPFISIPTSLATCSVRTMIQRPKMKNGPQGVAHLMLHTLKSYPLMMMSQNTLPPFIHQRIVSSDIENNDMELVNNCINLVHMISSKLRGSRKLFWRNVRQECERMCAECLRFNKWELLAAMQALSIYILIRLGEGETDDNNLDSLLLATVTMTAKQFTYGGVTSDTCYGHEASWNDWIFEESRRRLAVIYRVLNLLVYFEPAGLCDLQTDLVLAPLPAKKELWEAENEFAWKNGSQREPHQATFGLTTNGELVKLGDIYCGDSLLLNNSLDHRLQSRSTANWEEWCTGMDGLGGLVMLATSFIS